MAQGGENREAGRQLIAGGAHCLARRTCCFGAIDKTIKGMSARFAANDLGD